MPSRRVRPFALLATVIVGIAGVVLLACPQLVGAQLLPVVAQLLAFRALLALILGVGAAIAAAVALFTRRWGVAAGIAMVLAAASITNGVVLLSRGGGDATPGGELTVVAWNTQGGAASPHSIARLVIETDADIVSLPETDARAAAEVARLLAEHGQRMVPATTYGETGDSWIPTSVLISEGLGEYRVDATAGSTPGLPSAVWRPVDGTGPTIVAAHPMPPLPDVIDQWRSGLRWVADQCDARDVIIAGDLNATVDHLSGLGVRDALIGQCEDAAVEAGAAAVGSWPTSLPAWLAAPIDHVLVGPAWTVRGAKVLTSYDDAGSDHRPIVAVLDGR